MESHIRLISDRQDLLETARARRLGLEQYEWDRLDMYWVVVRRKGANGSEEVTYSVDPHVDGSWGWGLTRQHGEGTKRTYKFAKATFEGSEEEARQIAWTEALVAGGYFEDGRFPGRDTEKCQHCSGRFKKGTAHEHVKYDGRVIAHNYRLYHAQKALGIEPSWSPGGGDQLSLEEMGLLHSTLAVGPMPPELRKIALECSDRLRLLAEGRVPLAAAGELLGKMDLETRALLRQVEPGPGQAEPEAGQAEPEPEQDARGESL